MNFYTLLSTAVRTFATIVALVLILFGLVAIYIDEDLSAITGLVIFLLGIALMAGIFA